MHLKHKTTVVFNKDNYNEDNFKSYIKRFTLMPSKGAAFKNVKITYDPNLWNRMLSKLIFLEIEYCKICHEGRWSKTA